MNINGITPVIIEDDFFVLDKSGSFSLDKSVWATIYLVGGGCDGADGYYDENNKTVHGGTGGDSGYVYKFGKIVLFKDIDYSVGIAGANDKGGTYICIRDKKYSCADMGKSFCTGGLGSIINSQRAMINAQNGTLGVLTPIGYVGSSGGGGCAVCKNFTATFGNGGLGAGNGRLNIYNGVSDELQNNIAEQIDAQNYGCGGGGNTFCYNCTDFADINLKSKGKGGCIIITCELYDENFPDLTVRYWGKSNMARNSDNHSRETLKALQDKYMDVLAKNIELKDKIRKIESAIN